MKTRIIKHRNPEDHWMWHKFKAWVKEWWHTFFGEDDYDQSYLWDGSDIQQAKQSFTDKLSDIHHRILILELDAETSDEEAESLAPIKEAFDQFWRENYEQKDVVFYRST